MTMSLRHLFRMSLATIAMFILSCATTTHTDAPTGQYVAGTGPIDKLQLPAPFATPSARNTSKVIGWPKGRMPKAGPGFEVSLFADNLDNLGSTNFRPKGVIRVVEGSPHCP